MPYDVITELSAIWSDIDVRHRIYQTALPECNVGVPTSNRAPGSDGEANIDEITYMHVDWRHNEPPKFWLLESVCSSLGGAHCSSLFNWHVCPTARRFWHPLPSSGQKVPREHIGCNMSPGSKLKGNSSLLHSLGWQVPLSEDEQKVLSSQSVTNL